MPTAVFELLQDPPGVPLEDTVLVPPIHMLVEPLPLNVPALGSGLTVIVFVADVVPQSLLTV